MDSFSAIFAPISKTNSSEDESESGWSWARLWKYDRYDPPAHRSNDYRTIARGLRRVMVSAMAVRRRRAPEPIASTLGSIIDRLDSEGHFAIVRLVQAWPEIVGEAIARRTEVLELKFHTAVVRVSGAMWIQELNLLKPEILARLAARVGDDAVRDLRFVQGRLSRRPARPRLRTVARAPRRAIELPELKDPDLRRAFESLIEAWGRAPR